MPTSIFSSWRRRLHRAAVPAPTPDGAAAAELETLRERNRLLGAFFGAAARLANSDAVDSILSALCESLVEASPHVRLAWAWRGRTDSATIRPQIFHGPAKGYAESLEIRRSALTERGPAFRALAGAADAAHVHALAPYKPWREAARTYGIQVAAALPLLLPERDTRAILVFYADDLDYFERVGIEPFAAFARFGEVALARADAERGLRLAAHSDALTGLANRRAMEAHLRDALAARNAGQPAPAHLLLIDIDHFKQINDHHGHAAGDHVLRALGAALTDMLRRDDRVARWGGEEFLVLLGGRLGIDEAQAVAERLRQGIAALPLQASPHPSADAAWLKVSASIGGASLAQLPSDLRPHDWVRAADEALYAAKRGGRNRVVWSAETATV
jgi:diguanylate cyclase (GGDEF)-like protein